MRNFQVIVIIRSQAYTEILKSALVYKISQNGLAVKGLMY